MRTYRVAHFRIKRMLSVLRYFNFRKILSIENFLPITTSIIKSILLFSRYISHLLSNGFFIHLNFTVHSDRELKQWYVDYDVSLTWCNNTQEKIQDLSSPEEEITLVEEQHDEIEV